MKYLAAAAASAAIIALALSAGTSLVAQEAPKEGKKKVECPQGQEWSMIAKRCRVPFRAKLLPACPDGQLRSKWTALCPSPKTADKKS